MRTVSSWGVAPGTTAEDEAGRRRAVELADGEMRVECASGRLDALSTLERAVLGRRCKRLIDFGRVVYVQRVLGLQCELLHYCDAGTTPENALLLAWRREGAEEGGGGERGSAQ